MALATLLSQYIRRKLTRRAATPLSPQDRAEGAGERIAMDFTFTTELHYLIHHVDGEFVAHCLDMDLVGSGATTEDAIDELNTAVRSVVFFAIKTETFDVLSLSKGAPEEYWTLFETARVTSGTEVRTLEVSAEFAPVAVKQCHFTYCLAVAA